MIIERTLYNAREPELKFTLSYDRKTGDFIYCDCLFTAQDHRDSYTGEYYYCKIGIEIPDGGDGFDFYVRYLDEDKSDMNKFKHCHSLDEAWSELPSFITTPDHFEEVRY